MDDSDEAIAAQWRALWKALSRPDTALVMHMPDHYSLVHAAREWTAESRVQSSVLRSGTLILGALGGDLVALDHNREFLPGWRGGLLRLSFSHSTYTPANWQPIAMTPPACPPVSLLHKLRATWDRLLAHL